MFLGREVPACGFSLGLERLLVLMDERGMFAGAAGPADVMVAVFDEASKAASLALARELRAAGFRVLLHDDAAKLGKQFQDAETRKVPFVAFAGHDEAAKGAVSLKDVASRETAVVPRAHAVAWLRERVQR
jgi:histidyl-tRNA synthetase